MSIFRNFANIANIARSNIQIPTQYRQISLGALRFCKVKEEEPAAAPNNPNSRAARFNIDRTQIIPVETSIKYLQSEAYKTAYSDQPVWVPYRRNFKGVFAPKKTRKTCIRGGVISCGSPCPICRDEYLVLDYRNLELLKQFISPYTGQVLSYSKTGLCQKTHEKLLIAIERAWDRGLIPYQVPFREFDYAEYYGENWQSPQQQQQQQQ